MPFRSPQSPRPESNPAYDAERATYLMLDDFGGRLVRLAGDAESINRPTQIQDLLDVQ